jgi:hypothetical protein
MRDEGMDFFIPHPSSLIPSPSRLVFFGFKPAGEVKSQLLQPAATTCTTFPCLQNRIAPVLAFVP